MAQGIEGEWKFLHSIASGETDPAGPIDSFDEPA
jgi:hypothetical protein